MNDIKSILLFIVVLCIVNACSNGPEVVQPSNQVQTPGAKQSTGVFDDGVQDPVASNSASNESNLHQVVVLEVLPTEKYVYLNVEEDGDQFWIATRKQDVKKGGKYFFKGGLLKTNFESKEYNRVFEKVYLVGNIVPVGHGEENKTDKKKPIARSKIKSIDFASIKPQEGSIKISDIVSNPSSYEGKQVQLTGRCVKLNANIMGRNWIHLEDGSKDDYDFVLTTNTAIPEGHVVTLTGTVTLGKDFGSGYRYDILVENAQLVK